MIDLSFIHQKSESVCTAWYRYPKYRTFAKHLLDENAVRNHFAARGGLIFPLFMFPECAS